MFQAALPKTLILKKLIEAIRELVTDVNIEVNEEGVFLQAMDASHVALVSFALKRDQFENFECPQPHIFGLNINNMSKILKCADNDDKTILRADKGASKLTLIFEGRLEEKYSTFNLNLIDLDTEQLGIPDYEYPVVVNMRSDEFSRVCRELSQISDTLVISANKTIIGFAVGGDIGDGLIEFKNKSTGKNPVIIEITEEVSCSFAMRYLNLFNKAATLAEEVQISLSPNLPLVVSYVFELGYIKYYLAPKVNDE